MTEKEFNNCVDSFADNVYRFLLKHTKDVDFAKDVVQETFTRLWEKRDDVDFFKSKSYIFATAYHKLIDDIRHNAFTVYEFKVEREISHNYSDLKDILNMALETLPQIQRSAILLRDYEGYSYDEIGDILNLSQQQVKVYIFRARTTLKTYIGSIDNII
ncbi:MAG: ylaC 1 [Bacteroidetes bacterium]|nr:ylaC 1 [Bacteroidota bacterium]